MQVTSKPPVNLDQHKNLNTTTSSSTLDIIGNFLSGIFSAKTQIPDTKPLKEITNQTPTQLPLLGVIMNDGTIVLHKKLEEEINKRSEITLKKLGLNPVNFDPKKITYVDDEEYKRLSTAAYKKGQEKTQSIAQTTKPLETTVNQKGQVEKTTLHQTNIETVDPLLTQLKEYEFINIAELAKKKNLPTNSETLPGLLSQFNTGKICLYGLVKYEPLELNVIRDVMIQFFDRGLDCKIQFLNEKDAENLFQSFSTSNYSLCCDEVDVEKSNYFICGIESK